jgi:transposase
VGDPTPWPTTTPPFRLALAYFNTKGVSNGGTEAINLLIETTRRLADGFRNLNNYRLRILLVADGTRSWRA